MGVRVISTTGRIANRTKGAINLFCSEGEGNWWNEASPGWGELLLYLLPFKGGEVDISWFGPKMSWHEID